MMIRKLFVAVCAILFCMSFIPSTVSAVVIVTHSESPYYSPETTTVNLTYTISDGAGDPAQNGLVGVDVVSNHTKTTLLQKAWRLLGGADSDSISWDFTSTRDGFYTVYYNNTVGGGSYDTIGYFKVFQLNVTTNVTPSIANPKSQIVISYSMYNECPTQSVDVNIQPYIQRPDGTEYAPLSKNGVVPANSTLYLNWTVYQTTGGLYDVWFYDSIHNRTAEADGFYINFTGVYNTLPTAVTQIPEYTIYTDTVIEFQGFGIDPDGYIVNYTWIIENDRDYYFYTEDVQFVFDYPGTYFVSFKVTDNDGGSDIEILTMTVVEEGEIIVEDRVISESTYYVMPAIFIILFVFFSWLFLDQRSAKPAIQSDWMENHADMVAVIMLILFILEFATRVFTNLLIEAGII